MPETPDIFETILEPAYRRAVADYCRKRRGPCRPFAEAHVVHIVGREAIEAFRYWTPAHRPDVDPGRGALAPVRYRGIRVVEHYAGQGVAIIELPEPEASSHPVDSNPPRLVRVGYADAYREAIRQRDALAWAAVAVSRKLDAAARDGEIEVFGPVLLTHLTSAVRENAPSIAACALPPPDPAIAMPEAAG